MKKLNNFYTLLFALLVLGFTACDSATDNSREYGDVDVDGDYELNDEEFGTVWTESDYYGRWDENDDGFISENEWISGRDRDMEDLQGGYGDWDVNGDNMLDETEFREGAYGYYDRDGNRMINEEEYNSWFGAKR